MTIHLPKDLEPSIAAAVQSGDFASADDAVAEAWRTFQRQRQKPAAAPTLAVKDARPIWELIEEDNRTTPPEVWDDLPTDLATQHDHYLYGTPKLPTI